MGGHVIMAGQCLDELKDMIDEKYAPVFNEVYDLWDKYHLNDLHPECEHQAALGWREMGREEVELKKFVLTREAIRQKNALERRSLDALKAGKTVKLSEDEQVVASLAYSVKTIEDLLDSIRQFYELDAVERKARGWLQADEFDLGLLGKPCPICGYRYGHGWNYLPIPKEDEKRVLRLFEEKAA